MKNTFLSTVCAIALLLASCTKNSSTTASATKQVTIDKTVSSGSLLSLDLGSYGNRAVITKQASDYTTSAIVQSGVRTPVYQFSSATKTSVAQQVLVAVTNSGRCDNSQDSTIVTVNLNVE